MKRTAGTLLLLALIGGSPCLGQGVSGETSGSPIPLPLDSGAAPALSAPPATRTVAPSLPPTISAVAGSRKVSGPPMPAEGLEAIGPQPVPSLVSTTAPATLAFSNSKRLAVHYEVKDGGSPVTSVELWYTRDTLRWQRISLPAQAHSPAVVDVPEEGRFGFTVVAAAADGFGKRSPQPGEQPQTWVEVDLTRPAVQLQGVDSAVEGDARYLILSWKAADKNLGPRPISLSYALKSNGPWVPIASELENNGHYEWKMPPNALPERFYVRVEAADRAGNVGTFQTPQPVKGDWVVATASIVKVEPVAAPAPAPASAPAPAGETQSPPSGQPRTALANWWHAINNP